MCSSQCLRFRWFRDRQPKQEQRATFGLVLAYDLPVMVLDDAINRAQPQASALADGLRRIERIEYATRLFDSRSRIGEGNDDLVMLLLGLHLQQSAAFLLHSVSGIFDDLNKS